MGSGIGEITAVVVRYYGGIKLGTGGLVRAYGNGVQLALAELPIIEKVPQAEFLLQCDYAQISMIETLLQQVGGGIVQSEYGAAVDLRLTLPALGAAEIAQRLYNLSRGSLVLQPV
jgi:putative IMPACT (imprinted ancient) family translation regulator